MISTPTQPTVSTPDLPPTPPVATSAVATPPVPTPPVATLSAPTRPVLMPPLDEGVRRAADEVTALIRQLEPTLAPRQRSLLHQVRLASESLGAARATLVLRLR